MSGAFDLGSFAAGVLVGVVAAVVCGLGYAAWVAYAVTPKGPQR